MTEDRGKTDVQGSVEVDRQVSGRDEENEGHRRGGGTQGQELWNVVKRCIGFLREEELVFCGGVGYETLW